MNQKILILIFIMIPFYALAQNNTKQSIQVLNALRVKEDSPKEKHVKWIKLKDIDTATKICYYLTSGPRPLDSWECKIEVDAQKVSVIVTGDNSEKLYGEYSYITNVQFYQLKQRLVSIGIGKTGAPSNTLPLGEGMRSLEVKKGITTIFCADSEHLVCKQGDIYEIIDVFKRFMTDSMAKVVDDPDLIFEKSNFYD